MPVVVGVVCHGGLAFQKFFNLGFQLGFLSLAVAFHKLSSNSPSPVQRKFKEK
jgi:hypothetical protein